MVKYRGQTSPIRQYIKEKPHPWGFKVCGRSGDTSILYDFHVYQGGNGKRSELGQGADVVLNLTSTLEQNKGYKNYADILFTSVPLLIKLSEKGMFYTGLLRNNRLSGARLLDEKALKKIGRGKIDHQIKTTHNIAMVKWYDNRAVTLLSSNVSVEPVAEANRWNKAKKHRSFQCQYQQL
ncbi:piggyBac transposable element-derived protein 3-like [Watersipora subatra]|uniref:piggyBac transposable element-derived protein 3-like n=1 Tax=Watersipora subatra TaxID=2589382 RepID=UPI00355C0417